MAFANNLLQSALNEIAHLHSGEDFIVRDLFKGYEWNRIPIGERLLLGTLFLNESNQKGSKVVAVQKTTSGQQKYRVL